MSEPDDEQVVRRWMGDPTFNRWFRPVRGADGRMHDAAIKSRDVLTDFAAALRSASRSPETNGRDDAFDALEKRLNEMSPADHDARTKKQLEWLDNLEREQATRDSALPKCNACLKGRIHLTAKPGRLVRYKGQNGYVLPANLAVPICGSCGDMLLNESLAQAFDEALEPQWKARNEPPADKLNAVRSAFENLSFADREDFIRGYCSGCGGDRPCHCENDE